jgi:hypothetical protein
VIANKQTLRALIDRSIPLPTFDPLYDKGMALYAVAQFRSKFLASNGSVAQECKLGAIC